jgi:1-acyl-sn-glycerol-3-phosphate acyltransferase
MSLNPRLQKHLQSGSTKGLSEAEIAELVAQNHHIYSNYFDMNYVMSLETNLFDLVNDHYFRAQLVGFEEVPMRNNPDRPLIYISNHSGMAFPWDAMIFGAGFLKHNNYDISPSVRGLAHPMLSKTTLMNPFLIPDFWKRVGGIDATSLNFETVMHFNESNILIYPEGVPGIAKGFNNKYKLQRFATSFVRMSIKYQTDVIPVMTINGEYINPYSYKSEWINRIFQKLGIPFLPLSPITLLIIIFPWLFYFAFPAQLTYVLGKRISPYKMTDKCYEDLSPQEIEQITHKVRHEMQVELKAAAEKYGKNPYDFKKWLKVNLRDFRRLPFFFSPGWPLLFAEHERLYQKSPKSDKPVKMDLGLLAMFKVFLHNPFVLSFFIPILGWIPILLKGYSKNKLK